MHSSRALPALPALARPALLAALVLAAGCEAPEPPPLPEAANLPLRGTTLPQPLGKVDFTLPDAGGEPYDFRAETDGKIALLFFGYTFCPDICPVHMATLAAALDELEPSARERIEVVFVTVDPERDTPERLRGWLDAFDSTFVGLRGTPEEIEDALAFYRFPAPERSGDEAGYTVGHPALIYGFTPDGLGRVLYGVETTRQEWVHDLEMLAGYPWEAWADERAPGPDAAPGPGEPAAGGTDAGAEGEPLTRIGDVTVLDAYAPEPVGGGDRTALYLTLRNDGPRADTLVGLATAVAGRAGLHAMRREDGMVRMEPLEGVPLPPGAAVRLEPGGLHGMLEGVAPGAMAAGATVEVELRLARGGSGTARVRVVTYESVGG